jgi:hypothetical protein
MNKEYYIICRTEALLRECIIELEKAGVNSINIYSPKQIEDNRNGKKSFFIGLSVLIIGAVGFALSIFFQYWTSQVDYPINVGGKPFFEVIYSIPVMFAITSLFVIVGGTICFMIISGLPNWNEKSIGEIPLPTDKYVIKFDIENDLTIQTLNSENYDILELK